MKECSIESTSSAKLRLLLAGLAAFLLAVPWWAPYCQELGGRSLCLASDMMMAGGWSILFALLFSRLAPSRILDTLPPLLEWIERNFRWLGPLFLFSCFLILGHMNRRILHSFLNSADEHSCYFLAECIRLGKWWVEPHPLSEFFQVVHVGNRDGKWFSVYPPGWPLLFALGLEWGIQDGVNPALTILSLILLFQVGKKLWGLRASWLSLFFITLTPYFLFTAASYFSHSTCLFMVSLFFFSFLKWREEGDSKTGRIWAVLAAFAVGYGINTRYLSMIALAAPFMVYHFIPVVRKKRKWETSDTLFTVTLLFLTSFVFIHNFIVTGDPTEPPNHYDKRWERLGFRGDYSVKDGLIYILARFIFLTQWISPVIVGLFLFYCFQKRSEDTFQRLFRLAFFYPVVAYFFYYSWGGNQYGPRYYYEGLPFLVFAVAEVFRRQWIEGSDTTKKFLLGLLLTAFVISPYQFYRQGSFYEAASRERRALYDLADQTITKPSIVFIKGFLGHTLVMSEEDAVRNSPSLDAKILYAHDLGEKNQALMQHYPERKYYRGTFDRIARQSKLEKI